MRRTIGLLLATVLAASLLLSLPSAATAQEYTPQTIQESVPTKHGLIYVEATYPTKNDKPVKGPAVLTYSPYSVLGRGNVASDWVEEGYVSVFADVVGTGNSGGCYDYGGKREKETGHAIVEWIAKQKWSNGKVGMIGGSYNGTTQWATAVTNPPHLTTIVPEAAIGRWYSYAFSGGMRYFLNNERPYDEGFDTPLAFDFGFAIPPPTDVQDPDWADKVASTITPCDEIQHTEKAYDDTPDYDKFWKERDYQRDAKKIDVPVLISHNWGDWNVKQENAWMMWKALRKSRSPKVSLYMGGRYDGHGTPGGDYDKVVRAWFDHYLMGKNNGIDRLPEYISQQSHFNGYKGWHKGRFPKTRNVKLYAQETFPETENDYTWKLLPTKWRPGFLPPAPAGFPMNAPNGESHANQHPRANHEWWYFASPPLKKDIRVAGEIKVKLYSKVYRKWVTLTPVILDVDHSCHEVLPSGLMYQTVECTTDTSAQPGRFLHSTTRGFLDSRYRNGLGKQVPVKPGKPFGATVPMKPIDYVFKKGHSIGLNVMTENIEWVVSKHADEPPQDCDVTDVQGTPCARFFIEWKTNRNQVILPVVNAPKDPATLFARGHMGH